MHSSFKALSVYVVCSNQNIQHPENNKKQPETREQDGSRHKIQGSKERQNKFISNNEIDE